LDCIACQYDQIVQVEDWHQQIRTRLFDVLRMIRLVPTKPLINEKRVDTVLPHPQRLLEPVQIFLNFTYKVFFPLLYEPLQLIHVDLHLQYSIKKMLFLHLFGKSSNVWLLLLREYMIQKLMVMNLTTEANLDLVEIHFGHLRMAFCY
jgi:hypothetical protein